MLEAYYEAQMDLCGLVPPHIECSTHSARVEPRFQRGIKLTDSQFGD